MNRKIFYVDCYCDGVKQRNIGFIKFGDNDFFIMLRGLPFLRETICKVYVIVNEHEKTFLEDVLITNGYGQAQIKWPNEMQIQNNCEIYVAIDNRRYGSCIIENPQVKKIEKTNIQSFSLEKKAHTSKPLIEKGKKMEQKQPIEPFSEAMPVMESDKWKQLCNNYPQVHIFPEADTIVIKPKDMIILTQEYHELAINSFVLHAYYNYRQLLLLRYCKGAEITYYIGVPGVYYEREKRIALLFGFEGFENGESRLVNEDRRQVYQGCFGYYMKQVNI